ncbi:MAG: LCP family protein [Candidatus Kerfeldbacteria bacterium]|nr:LCP family protein [Candidatus Kerfeldbacteria bacterium]
MEPSANKPISAAEPSADYSSNSRINQGKFFLYAVFIIISLGVIWLSRQPRVQATILEWPQHSLWENVKQLISGQDKLLAGETDGRINFLILGEGGPGHDGPYLTDTIILASLNPQTKQVGLMPIPRDLVVPIPGAGSKRINYANAIGEQQAKDSGPILASTVVNQVFGLPIHYYVRLDFTGFVKIVDQLGGLPLEVPSSFVDKDYPDEQHGYQTVSFEAGWQIMSGERALQYARSRHGNGGQSSDFARSKRQLQIMAAIKNKLLSPATFLNPRLALQVYRTLRDSVITNLDAQDAIRLAHMVRSIDINNIKQQILDDSPQGLLKQIISEDGAYLLVPKTPDYSDLKTAAANLLSQQSVRLPLSQVIIKKDNTP